MTRCRSPWVLLCIDDQPQALEIRKRLLERAGYRVLTTTSAHQALELFRANDVDLVLAEHIAPSSIDGPTLAAAMKLLKPYVPVAIYSADIQPSPEDLRFADAFITKLISVGELLRTIERLLPRRRVARAA